MPERCTRTQAGALHGAMLPPPSTSRRSCAGRTPGFALKMLMRFVEHL